MPGLGTPAMGHPDVRRPPWRRNFHPPDLRGEQFGRARAVLNIHTHGTRIDYAHREAPCRLGAGAYLASMSADSGTLATRAIARTVASSASCGIASPSR